MTFAAKFLKVQNELNKKLAEDWETKGWAYPDAMLTEAAEAYNHLNWEWWRSVDRQIDWNQVKLEWVDVAHFLFSEVIAGHHQGELSQILEMFQEGELGTHDETDKSINIDSLKCSIKNFIGSVISYDIYKKEDWVTSIDDFRQVVYWFLNVVADLKLSLSEFYTLFIGKVCLNQLRWKNGYKKGILDLSNPLATVVAEHRQFYIKQWNGKEDNVWLAEYAATLDPSDEQFKQKLEAALDAKYKEIYDSAWAVVG